MPLERPKISTITDTSGTTYDLSAKYDSDGNVISDTYATKEEIPEKGLVILSYGISTWADFLDAYQSNNVVYCRASSNSNPATGSQTRLAFMAYVSDATNPTNVEFQYYRSVSTHSDSQQGDQVYVYKLTSAGAWSVTVRENYTKIAAGKGLSGTWSSGTYTTKADLVSETNLTNAAVAATEVAGRVYPVAPDANGKLAVNVPWESGGGGGDGTVTSVATGVGLTGGPVTTSGTIKANLVSETAYSDASTNASGANTIPYAIGVDSNSKLAVRIPQPAFFGVCNTSASTAEKTTTILNFPDISAGLILYLYMSSGNNVDEPTLSINSGEAKYIYKSDGNQMSKATAGPLGSWRGGDILCLVYHNSAWRIVEANTTTELRYYGSFSVGSDGIAANSVIASSTTSGYATVKSGTLIDITKPILYWGSLKTYSGAASVSSINNVFYVYREVNLQNNVANWVAESSGIVYIVGTISGNQVTVSSDVFTTTVPSSADGKVYIPIGKVNTMTSPKKEINFYPSGKVYAYQNGLFQEYDPNYSSNVHTSDVVNNFVTTASGYVADARALKTLEDGKVSKSGDTMSGNLKIERNGEAYVVVNNTNTEKQMEFISTTAGNRGLYDDATGKWLTYFNTNGDAVYTPGYALSSGATWWRARNNDIPREIDVGVNASGVIGLYDRNNDKFMIQSDANGNISLPQVLSDAVKTSSNFITRSNSGVKGTNPSSLLGSGYFYMEKDSSGTTGTNRFGSFEFAYDTAGATYAYVKAYRSVANSNDYGEISIVHPKTGAPYPRYRVSASGSITSYDIVPPVGSIICMSTNTAPSYPGTWELVDKEFKAQNVTKTTSVSINTTNVTSVSAVYAVYSNHTITVYVDGLKTKVALADSDLTLMTLTPANFGVSAFGNYQFNITAFSDNGDALITLNSNASGVITSKDAFKIAAGSGTAHSVPAGTELSRFTLQYHLGGYSYLNDSYCDKFYFKRTA